MGFYLPPPQGLQSATIVNFFCPYPHTKLFVCVERPHRVDNHTWSVGPTDMRTPGNPPANTLFRNLTILGFPLLACARAPQHDSDVPALRFIPMSAGFHKKSAPIHTYATYINSTLQNRRNQALFGGSDRFDAITHV